MPRITTFLLLLTVSGNPSFADDFVHEAEPVVDAAMMAYPALLNGPTSVSIGKRPSAGIWRDSRSRRRTSRSTQRAHRCSRSASAKLWPSEHSNLPRAAARSGKLWPNAARNSFVALAPASGCNELLELGAATHGEVEGSQLVDALSQIRKYRPDARAVKLVIAGASLVYVTREGKLLLPPPVDYLSWTADIDEFFQRPKLRTPAKTILVCGEASTLAQLRLGESGLGARRTRIVRGRAEVPERTRASIALNRRTPNQ
jgi:hypothetical protein